MIELQVIKIMKSSSEVKIDQIPNERKIEPESNNNYKQEENQDFLVKNENTEAVENPEIIKRRQKRVLVSVYKRALIKLFTCPPQWTKNELDTAIFLSRVPICVIFGIFFGIAGSHSWQAWALFVLCYILIPLLLLPKHLGFDLHKVYKTNGEILKQGLGRSYVLFIVCIYTVKLIKMIIKAHT